MKVFIDDTEINQDDNMGIRATPIDGGSIVNRGVVALLLFGILKVLLRIEAK